MEGEGQRRSAWGLHATVRSRLSRDAVVQRLSFENGEQTPGLHRRELTHGGDLRPGGLNVSGAFIQICVEQHRAFGLGDGHRVAVEVPVIEAWPMNEDSALALTPAANNLSIHGRR